MFVWDPRKAAENRFLFVVFTEPDEETTRVISRKAERREQDLYYRQETP
jgi:uncharacterized DUF497 family protein